MQLVVTCEARFSLAADGSVWTETTFDYDFWRRYLSAFDRIRVVARASFDAAIYASYKPVTGPRVELSPVPFYLGPRQFFQRRRSIQKALKAALGDGDALLCRVSSPIAGKLLSTLRGTGRPYALEIIGDPDEGLAPGTVRHPLRPAFRWMAIRALHQQCRHAAAIAYVTRETLQKKYPGGAEAFTTYYSSLSCIADDFSAEPRVYDREALSSPKLIFVGSLAQMYKAPDVLIRAVNLLASEIDLSLTMVGDGKHRAEMENLAKSLGIAGNVNFLGALPSGKAIREQLDRADLFVMPSRTEGLPRAMIEAMARGLPCIGTRVGGIPELLDDDSMVPANDPEALAKKIRAMVCNPELMTAMSKRNLLHAAEYRPELLAQRRDQFYHFLRNQTEHWLNSRQATRETLLRSELSA